MALLFKMTLTGPEQMAAAWNEHALNIARYGMKGAIDVLFKQGELRARSESPVRTGFLRSSIKSEATSTGAVLMAEAPYAAFVDQGTRYMKARPFFTNAVRYIQDNMGRVIQQAINEQAGRTSRKYFGAT